MKKIAIFSFILILVCFGRKKAAINDAFRYKINRNNLVIYSNGTYNLNFAEN